MGFAEAGAIEFLTLSASIGKDEMKGDHWGGGKGNQQEGMIRQEFSGEKGLCSAVEEALLPRSAFGGRGFSGLEVRFVYGRFAWADSRRRSSPPKDDEADYDRDVWAGVVPLKIQHLAPVADPALKAGVELPAYLK